MTTASQSSNCSERAPARTGWGGAEDMESGCEKRNRFQNLFRVSLLASTQPVGERCPICCRPCRVSALGSARLLQRTPSLALIAQAMADSTKKTLNRFYVDAPRMLCNPRQDAGVVEAPVRL